AGTIAVGIASGFGATTQLGVQANADPDGVITNLAGLAAVLLIALSCVLFWRWRSPVLFTSIAAGLCLVLPGSPVPALFALVAVLRLRRGGTVIGMVALVTVATAVSVLWDLSAGTHALSRSFFPPLAAETGLTAHALWVVPLVTGAMMIAPVARGLVLRARDERDGALLRAEASQGRVTALSDEVVSEQDRREVAREIHDTLSARLSTISLYTSALEALPTSTAEQREQARLIRGTVQDSMSDVRRVVDHLRDPGAAREAAGLGLGDLHELVDQLFAEHDRVRARITVSDEAGCDRRVAHATYRIVQEALSNSRKHAPGCAVELTVRGGPATGVSITVLSRGAGSPGAPAGGSPL
ncbi:sensor histidine kinase, partial [Leucobacter sp. M11]|uniref:sensor histidine kinase n=1 Tax=Leucobacter sp. M11 TaxID=2993565 RepID=UPI002D7F0076